MACRRGAQDSRTGRGRFASSRRRALQSADRETDFGVYIHWPFCLSKCPYCDFNSHVRHAGVDEARHVRAFTAEIAATAARVPGPAAAAGRAAAAARAGCWLVFFGGSAPPPLVRRPPPPRGPLSSTPSPSIGP